MTQGLPPVQAGRDIVHCEHVKSGKYSLLWWEECPECKGGEYIAHRCLECGEEYKQGEEGAHTHWREKDPDLAEFVRLSRDIAFSNDQEAWGKCKEAAVYGRLASVYEKSELFKLFMKARETK